MYLCLCTMIPVPDIMYLPYIRTAVNLAYGFWDRRRGGFEDDDGEAGAVASLQVRCAELV